jgi:SAM-dependent methyltransferase
MDLTGGEAVGLYVQYGAGFCAPRGWVNFDASLSLRCERLPLVGKFIRTSSYRFPLNVQYGNILTGLPVADNSCNGVYASHVLEHLSLNEMRRALANTYRILKPGGVFRCLVPDLRSLARTYLSSSSPTAAHEFVSALGMGREHAPKSLMQYARLIWGKSAHLWMWDCNSMELELRNAGFLNVRRCEYGDASDRMFHQVEELSRFAGAVAMESEK